MDVHVRTYIHANLNYRFVQLPTGQAAFEIERSIRKGEWPHGKPFLNPLTERTTML